MIKNGILLTGGTGTRLLPFTSYTSKHLLNVAGKPIIDYPINTLKQMGIENLTIVVGSTFSGQILDYVKDGSKFGMNVNYCYQSAPLGIAHAINLCKKYIDNKFVVCLGDNVFSSPIDFNNNSGSAKIVLYEHQNLKRFGVASLDDTGIVKIEEKPQIIDEKLKNYAIAGCYLFDNKYFDYFKDLVPSNRGELEIVDIIKQYHASNELGYVNYNNQGVWLDVGTHESIALANSYFYSLNQVRSGNV
jgi:glucose-1-phosphate thymidylyltransferase